MNESEHYYKPVIGFRDLGKAELCFLHLFENGLEAKLEYSSDPCGGLYTDLVKLYVRDDQEEMATQLLKEL